MKIELIATFLPYFEQKKPATIVSFPTLVSLAALTPGEEISVQYEHTKKIEYNVDADIIGISFIYPFADHSFEVADKFLSEGRTVVLGGPYVTAFPEKCREHASSLVIGEAEMTWPKLVEDFKKNRLLPQYSNQDDPFPPLDGLPPPRFDLIVDDFRISQAITATRGCPHHCDFCFMKKVTKGFRTRPVKDVIRDLQHHEGRNWMQNKLVWFWDDNLIGDKKYAKELFTQLKSQNKWWVGQVTANFADDDELLKCAADSGCVGVFVGFESFTQETLNNINKFHNHVIQYRKIVKKIHSYGIAVSSGLMVGFDEDTTEIFESSVKNMNEIGIDFINPSILVPFEGTKIYDRLKEENRILSDKTYFYTGAVTAYKPKAMTADELNDGFQKLVHDIYSFKNFLRRLKTFIKEVPLRNIGTYLIFLVANVSYIFYRLRQVSADQRSH